MSATLAVAAASSVAPAPFSNAIAIVFALIIVELFANWSSQYAKPAAPSVVAFSASTSV